MAKVLFILKRRPDFNSAIHNTVGKSTGLFNSANFMNDMLVSNKVDSSIAVAVDANDIDRLVTQYQPTHVIIEAIWVPPLKFKELQSLHADVRWVVRLHSDLPFIANEGIAMDWLAEYSRYPRVYIAPNSERMLDSLATYFKVINGWTDAQVDDKLIYLPNYYPAKYKINFTKKDNSYVDICCFGAVRPLKNQLIQAHAALEFAIKKKKKLRFHINATRIEQKGDPILNNLRGMFEQLAGTGHELICHDWYNHDDFLQVCSTMDIGMQASFSETFNIVAADLTNVGVPVLGTKEIPWLGGLFHIDPTSVHNMVHILESIYHLPITCAFINQFKLHKYTYKTKKIWLTYLGKK